MKARDEVEPVRTPLVGYSNNHSDRTLSGDKDAGEAQLADLSVTVEQARETKGGPAAARWEQVIIGDLPPAL